MTGKGEQEYRLRHFRFEYATVKLVRSIFFLSVKSVIHFFMTARAISMVVFPILFLSCSEKEGAIDSQGESGSEEIPAAAETLVENISAVDAADLINTREDLVVLDIRTPGEFAEGHIAEARNIDFKGSDFETRIADLDRDIPYLVHCRSGGRSGMSMASFRELGFRKIYHLHKGFLDWEGAGLPVAK